MDEKFFRNLDKALEHTLDKKFEEPPPFGGKPGEPVPEVSADDLQAVWEFWEEMEKEHPGVTSTDIGIFERLCKPGADVTAVVYRAQNLALAFMFAKEQLEGFDKEKLFNAAATISMEWMGVGIVRPGPPYDFNEFLRLCAA